MKKVISIFAVICILCVGVFSTNAADEPVTAAGGNVTISATISGLSENVPVLVVILPENTDEATTLASLPAGTAATDIIAALKSSTLNVEYFDVVMTGAGGSLDVTAKMKSSLSTGNCYVFIKYLGSDRWVKLGMFEHVGQDDIDALVSLFNGSVTGYNTAITSDIAGNDILRKSAANTAYYQSLIGGTPDFTDDFCTVLAEKKPEGGFDISTLVTAFNETCAWIELRAEEDTLAILNAYNGIYWTLPLDADDDFAALSAAEQAKVLAAVKSGNHSNNTALAAAFEDELVLSNFRSVSDRDTLAALIAEGGAYSTYFADVRALLAAANVSDYEKLLIYNSVLVSNANCADFKEIEKLFTEAIKQLDDTSGGGSSNNSGSSNSSGRPITSTTGGGGSVVIPGIGASKPTDTKEIPFKDVASDSWFYTYIERLYDSKVINGISDNEFAPDASIQRQDFVKILVGVLDLDLSLNDSAFSDLSVGCYYEPYIMTAVEKGLISGMGDGSFGMGVDISRQDAAVIMSRVMADKVSTTETANFDDATDIAEYARGAVHAVSAAGIFIGDEKGNFNPKASLSRAEACAILCRLADIMKEV